MQKKKKGFNSFLSEKRHHFLRKGGGLSYVGRRHNIRLPDAIGGGEGSKSIFGGEREFSTWGLEPC